MKRRKTIIAVLIMSAFLLTGCGKKEENTDVQTGDKTLVRAEIDTVISVC